RRGVRDRDPQPERNRAQAGNLAPRSHREASQVRAHRPMTVRVRLAGAALGLALAACSRAGGAGPGVGGDARRIVSISPATTEALFAIGAGDRVVGRSRFCDWPAEASKLPIVGGFVDADMESILQLQPDLVVGAPGPSAQRLAARLGSHGVAT